MERSVHLHDPRLLRDEDARDLKSFFRPVDEAQWGKLEDLQSDIEGLDALYHQGWSDARWAQVKEQSDLLLCESWENLSLARACIEPRTKVRRRSLENYALFSHLIHRVEENLLILVPVEKLAAQATEVLGDFERTITDPTERAFWLGTDDRGPLPIALKKIRTEADSPTTSTNAPPSAALTAERELFRHASQIVNRYSERSYQQLNFAVIVRVAAALALTAAGVLAAVLYLWTHARWTLGMIVAVLAAAGSYVSIILSDDTRLRALGPARRHLAYMLVARPILGVVTALFFFLLSQSGVQFTLGGATQGATQGATADSKAALQLPRVTSDNSPSTVASYALAALVLGWGAESVLGKVLDSALNRIYKEADKKTRPEDEATPRMTASQAKEIKNLAQDAAKPLTSQGSTPPPTTRA